LSNDSTVAPKTPLIRSPLSIVGMVLTTISAVVFLVVFFADLFGMHTNPYIGIVFFLVLPGIFVFGLLLIPLGAWLERRRRAAGRAATEWPRLDLNNPDHRRAAVAIFALTMVNIVIVSLAAYRGVEYMDSVQFCGQACHSVMKPEATAHADGPHARVTCVECHIGSGATWFAKSKLSGTRQLFAVSFHTYSRPIPSPVENLRPARDTCEQCHWPAKFHGDKVQRIVEYADDEKNTESVTTLQVHVGGGVERGSAAQGIHWHADVANEIDYISTDDKRQVIPFVRVKDRTGAVREYTALGVTPDQLAKGERRRMDCMDCHNRPSHQMAATPERAVNGAMARRHPGGPAVRAARGGQTGQGELSDRGRGHRGDREGATRVLSRLVSGRLHVAPPGRRESGGGRAAGLQAQRVSGNERAVRHLSEQRRPHGLPGLLPLPRRQPRDERRQEDQPGLRHLPQDRVVPPEAAGAPVSFPARAE